jgi:hypothetical protein
VSCVILNAAHPRRLAGGEAALAEVDAALATPAAEAALGSLGGPAGPLPAAVVRKASEWSQVRGELTDRYRTELERRIPLPLVEVPYVFAERFGMPELERVAAHLKPILEDLPEGPGAGAKP